MMFITLATMAILGMTHPERPDDPAIEYLVSLKEPQTQMVDMVMSINHVDAEHIDVHLPVWRPGRYVIGDPSGTVRQVSAAAGSGELLPIQKIAKSSWRVQCSGVETVVVTYRVYANSLNDRTRHVDDSHAFLSPTSVFMFVAELRDKPVRITFDAPADWKVATGMEADPADAKALIAANYDVLADSPIEIGVHDVVEYDVDGTPHRIVIWGKAEYDAEKLKTDFAKITRAQCDLFGSFPYSRYDFLTHVSPGIGGGTEHLNSTVIQTGPQFFTDEGKYRGFLALVSHELFHTWNVKQFRPEGLKPYDYLHENYTNLLWVAEGTTSYYDNLILVRAGLMKPQSYLDHIGGVMDSELPKPGGGVQTLEESSFDAWIKFNKPTADSVNSTVSFYDLGELVNLLLDLEIREATTDAKSLDDVMRELYKRFPLAGPAYSTQDLKDIVSEVAGQSMDWFFDQYVSGVDALPLHEKFQRLGVQIAREAEETEGRRNLPWLGVETKDTNGTTTVTQVRADGPSYRAGINVNDEIVSINGKRIEGGNFNEVVGGLTPREEAVISISRRGQVREIPLHVGRKPAGSTKLTRIENPTEEQKKAYEAWMGAPWEAVEPKPEAKPAGEDAPQDAVPATPPRF